MLLIAALVSLGGMQIPLLVFFPMLVSVILLLGYDKIVAAMILVGSTAVGLIGSTYAYGNTNIIMTVLSLDITSEVIKEDNMEKNSNLFGGIVYSQKVLLTLVEKGLTREDAYRIVQKHALDAFENNGDFKKNLESDNEVTKLLTNDEIEECFDREKYLQNIDAIFEKFAL